MITDPAELVLDGKNGGSFGDNAQPADEGVPFVRNLEEMRNVHHDECCFNGIPKWLPGLTVTFDSEGALCGVFTAGNKHQGYKGRVHGGVISALIDASMAQCCMGHGIAGYTASLSVKYRRPVDIGIVADLKTTIVKVRCKVLYYLTCFLSQRGNVAVEGLGTYYRFE